MAANGKLGVCSEFVTNVIEQNSQNVPVSFEHHVIFWRWNQLYTHLMISKLRIVYKLCHFMIKWDYKFNVCLPAITYTTEVTKNGIFKNWIFKSLLI